MHPPVDPWGAPHDPFEPMPLDPQDPYEPPAPPLMYGRASVPPPAVYHDTSEYPEVDAAPRRRPPVDAREIGRRAMSGKPARERAEPRAPMPNVSWQRSSPASRRTMFDGWGFTFAGLVILFCGWGIWAASGGNASTVPPVVSLLFVIVVGAVVFTALRLASRVVLERMRGRRRPHARWAHFLTGLFLASVGVSYLLHNAWLGDGVAWFKDQWQQL